MYIPKHITLWRHSSIFCLMCLVGIPVWLGHRGSGGYLSDSGWHTPWHNNNAVLSLHSMANSTLQYGSFFWMKLLRDSILIRLNLLRITFSLRDKLGNAVDRHFKVHPYYLHNWSWCSGSCFTYVLYIGVSQDCIRSLQIKIGLKITKKPTSWYIQSLQVIVMCMCKCLRVCWQIAVSLVNITTLLLLVHTNRGQC